MPLHLHLTVYCRSTCTHPRVNASPSCLQHFWASSIQSDHASAFPPDLYSPSTCSLYTLLSQHHSRSCRASALSPDPEDSLNLQCMIASLYIPSYTFPQPAVRDDRLYLPLTYSASLPAWSPSRAGWRPPHQCPADDATRASWSTTARISSGAWRCPSVCSSSQ